MNQNQQALKMYLVADIQYPIIKQKMLLQSAADTLFKANGVAEKLVFSWKEIPTPIDGQCFLMFMPVELNHSPPDGIQWYDNETRSTALTNDGKEIIIYEKRNGKIASNKEVTMIRKRFILDNKKDVQLQLFHYLSHGSEMLSQAYPVDPTQYNQMKNPMHKQMLQNLPAIAPFQNSMYNIKNNNLKMGYKKKNQYIPDKMMMNPSNKMPMMNKMMRSMKDLPLDQQAQQLASINPNFKVIYGDDLDLVNVKDISMQRYKRNHDMIAELFDIVPCTKIQEETKKIQLPFNKEKLEEIKKNNQHSLTHFHNDKKNVQKLKSNHTNLNHKFNDLKHCNQIEALSKNKLAIETIFGTLSDVRISIKSVKDFELPEYDNETKNISL